MTSSYQEHDCTLSNPMEESARFKAIIELGKNLTKELGLDQSVDTLGRWMAHYIAELIQEAEEAKAEEKAEKNQICCDAILNLWKYRYTFPSGRRPLEEFEPLLKVLASLSPENSTPTYFLQVVNTVEISDESDETKYWLELVKDLDFSAKILICHCLRCAAQSALDKSHSWVGLAEAVSPDGDVEVCVVHELFKQDALLTKKKLDGIAEEILSNQILRLENSIKVAKKMVVSLRKEARVLNPKPKGFGNAVAL